MIKFIQELAGLFLRTFVLSLLLAGITVTVVGTIELLVRYGVLPR